MTRQISAALAVALAIASSNALAGGFSRGTADTDVLFDEGRFSTRDTLTYVNPNKKFDSKPGLPGVTTGSLDGKEISEGYWVPSLAFKYSVHEDFACAATYTVSNGGSVDNRGIMDRHGKLQESFTTDEYGMTCAYFVPIDRGRLALIAGAYYEAFNYHLDAFTMAGTTITPLAVRLGDGDIGWRAGVAYEIPEIAFRTSLVYRSGTSYDASGDASLTDMGTSSDARGWGRLPQSVELKVQSGIAADWLAFGSAKWTDWSVMDRLHLNFLGADFYNEYEWRDGLTLQVGVAHKFNDLVSGFTSVAWDRGVSTGWDLMGDTVAVTVGTTVNPGFGGEFRFVGSALFNEGVEETRYGDLSASSQDTIGYALQGQYNIKF